jgi:hypothetical protein
MSVTRRARHADPPRYRALIIAWHPSRTALVCRLLMVGTRRNLTSPREPGAVGPPRRHPGLLCTLSMLDFTRV